MAKYEATLKGSFTGLLQEIENGLLKGSVTASFEDGGDYEENGIRCAVRVYERYSIIGKNRVSLNITLVGCGDSIYICAIASGGSQAMFFKINTFGEDAFLDELISIIERYSKIN